METDSRQSPITQKRVISVPKILIGVLLVISQLIRQPGFGFWVGGTNGNSLLTPASDEVFGYNLFAAFMYALGVFLLWKGITGRRVQS